MDAIPLCLNTQDVDEIVQAVKLLEPTFAGINLEDISAPRCFEIEARLQEETNMFIFHDDQHGTAVVTLAGLINALKVVGKGRTPLIVVNGIGAAGAAIVRTPAGGWLHQHRCLRARRQIDSGRCSQQSRPGGNCPSHPIPKASSRILLKPCRAPMCSLEYRLPT